MRKGCHARVTRITTNCSLCFILRYSLVRPLGIRCINRDLCACASAHEEMSTDLYVTWRYVIDRVCICVLMNMYPHDRGSQIFVIIHSELGNLDKVIHCCFFTIRYSNFLIIKTYLQIYKIYMQIICLCISSIYCVLKSTQFIYVLRDRV